jgi:hypothetical protein
MGRFRPEEAARGSVVPLADSPASEKMIDIKMNK